jgi:Leucyl-tRNA synthetase, Domain 2
MNFQIKKLSILATLLFLSADVAANKETKTIVLSCPLLRVADNAGVFHGPIIDILQTRMDIVNLVQGVKTWSGIILDVAITDSNETIKIYCRRPEIMCGASFIAIAADHELATKIAVGGHKNAVTNFVMQRTTKLLFDRQMSSTNEAVFTGAYGINPFTQQLLPIYVSDYAIECFDVRQSKARLGIPAHNSKDLEFAQLYKLPVKLVVDVGYNAHGKKEDIAAPLLDKHGNLTEAYLGEYQGCIVVNSNDLNNAPLKDAAAYVIDYLEERNLGQAYSQTIQYDYNNALYSINDLAKIESALYKNMQTNHQTEQLKKDLAIALNYALADFLDIGEKFLINLKNTKTLMIALMQESCQLRNNDNCYLLRWSQLQGDINEKEVFRRDITSIKGFKIFCKDLVNFLGDFAYSCPKALENIRKQN